MHEMIAHFLKTASDKAIEFQVDPKIFAGLYVLHYLLLWPTVAWIVVAYRKGKHVSTLIIMALFFWIMPWFYPLFFGRLPLIADVGLVLAMIFIAWHGYHKIHRQITREKVNVAVAVAVETAEESA